MSRRETQGGTYRPYLPDYLCNREIRLTPEAVAAVSRGESAVRALDRDACHLTDTEALARLILRSEALSSSRIEGLQMNAGKLLEYEALDDMGVPHRLDATEAAVIANINAMQGAVSAASTRSALSLDDVCAINADLLAGTHMAERGGFLRTEQNWIGGNNVNPMGAAYVPPRPEHVQQPRCVQDRRRAS